MEMAHILVKCDEGKFDIFDDVKKMTEIKKIEKTFGLYDIVIKIEAESIQKIKSIIANNIRNRPGIISTITLVNA